MQLRKVVNHGNSRWRVSTYVDGQRKQRLGGLEDEVALGWPRELEPAAGEVDGQRNNRSRAVPLKLLH